MRLLKNQLVLWILAVSTLSLWISDFLPIEPLSERVDEFVSDWTGSEWLGSASSTVVRVSALLSFFITFALLIVGLDKVSKRLRFSLTAAGRARERNDAGMALVQQGGYIAAADEFTRALEQDPKCVAARVNRGVAYFHQKKLDEALADFDAALSASPNLVDAFAWRGQTWFSKGDTEKALQDFQQALRIEPGHLGVYLHRALVFSAREDYDRALEDYNVAIALGAREPCSYTTRGSILLTKEDFDRALADFDEAILRGDTSPVVFSNRGMAWLGKQNLDRAITDFNEAIRLDPKFALAFNNRGVALAKRGEYGKALTDFQTALELDPKFPNPHKNLAWLKATCPDASLRDGKQAIACATQALALAGKKIVEWRSILAAAYAEAGDFDQAVHWQTQCVNESPGKLKNEMQARLDLYKAKQPYREGLASVEP